MFLKTQTRKFRNGTLARTQWSFFRLRVSTVGYVKIFIAHLILPQNNIVHHRVACAPAARDKTIQEIVMVSVVASDAEAICFFTLYVRLYPVFTALLR